MICLIADDVHLDHLIEEISAQFFHYEVTLFPFVISILWEVLYRNILFFIRVFNLFLYQFIAQLVRTHALKFTSFYELELVVLVVLSLFMFMLKCPEWAKGNPCALASALSTWARHPRTLPSWHNKES